ncbi:MAG: ABC transporter permease, partial [Bacillota bacterium]
MLTTMLSEGFLNDLLVSTLRMATPLLLAALGEMYSERAGLINIGLEGLMGFGALFGFLGAYVTGSPWVGFVIGGLSGVLLNVVFAYATVTRNGDQIVNGMALNILSLGAASYIFRMFFGIKSTPTTIASFQPIAIPFLSKIPILGPAIFTQSAPLYFALLLVPMSFFFLYRTTLGLKLRSVGEHPRAADTLGISVPGMRYLALCLAGLLAGFGGAYLSLAYLNMFVENMVAGRGFIALAAVIFGKWTPVGVMLSALLFGFADAL